MKWKPLKVWVCSINKNFKGIIEDWSDIYEISNTGIIRNIETKEELQQNC